MCLVQFRTSKSWTSESSVACVTNSILIQAVKKRKTVTKRINAEGKKTMFIVVKLNVNDEAYK